MIGKDIARFHTIFWPAMLWSAGLEPPRHVWVHGWLLAAGGERMSKSRGNFLDPNDFVAAFGSDGARYVVLREVPFDRDAEVSWDSFVRRYNADLANDFGNLVNRTVSMTNRYLDGERPAPRPAGESPLAEGWGDTLAPLPRAARRVPAPRGARRALGVRRWREPGRRRRAAVGPGKAAKDGDEAAAARLRSVLGDLIEACRLVGLAAAPYMPTIAPRVLAQLGYAFLRRGRQWWAADPRRARLGRQGRGVGAGQRARTAIPAPRGRGHRLTTPGPRPPARAPRRSGTARGRPARRR